MMKWFCLTLGLLAITSWCAFADEPRVVPADEARQHINQECTVRMTVESSKNAEPRKKYFLDSMAKYRDFKNLSVQISYDDAEAFRKLGIQEPAAYYKGKTIHVTGKIELNLELNEVRINVTDPKQIRIIEP